MKLEIANSGKLVRVNLDGYETRAIPIAAADHARAVALVFANFGDGPEVAAKIVNAYNAHDALIAEVSYWENIRKNLLNESQLSAVMQFGGTPRNRIKQIRAALKLAGVES